MNKEYEQGDPRFIEVLKASKRESRRRGKVGRREE
jgi:hypothetical protein